MDTCIGFAFERLLTSSEIRIWRRTRDNSCDARTVEKYRSVCAVIALHHAVLSTRLVMQHCRNVISALAARLRHRAGEKFTAGRHRVCRETNSVFVHYTSRGRVERTTTYNRSQRHVGPPPALQCPPNSRTTWRRVTQEQLRACARIQSRRGVSPPHPAKEMRAELNLWESKVGANWSN